MNTDIISYKLGKYRYLLSNCTHDSKIDIYNRKIDYYSNLLGGNGSKKSKTNIKSKVNEKPVSIALQIRNLIERMIDPKTPEEEEKEDEIENEVIKLITKTSKDD